MPSGFLNIFTSSKQVHEFFDQIRLLLICRHHFGRLLSYKAGKNDEYGTGRVLQ